MMIPVLVSMGAGRTKSFFKSINRAPEIRKHLSYWRRLHRRTIRQEEPNTPFHETDGRTRTNGRAEPFRVSAGICQQDCGLHVPKFIVTDQLLHERPHQVTVIWGIEE